MADITLNKIRKGSSTPPIVFVHGFLCSHRDWQHQVSHFLSDHTVVSCDLRGHGDSLRGEEPMTIETVGGDVARLLGEENLTGAILVGHSMGCRVVMEAWRQAKDRVSSLVLVDGSRVGVAKAVGQASWNAAIVQKGYKTATLVPLKTVENCRNALQICKEISEIMDEGMASDVGSGALMANAGAIAAAYNVRINLKSISDEKFALDTKNELGILLKNSTEILAVVSKNVEKCL